MWCARGPKGAKVSHRPPERPLVYPLPTAGRLGREASSSSSSSTRATSSSAWQVVQEPAQGLLDFAQAALHRVAVNFQGGGRGRRVEPRVEIGAQRLA